MLSWSDWDASAQGEEIIESVAALTSEDSLASEAQGGAIRYISRHLLSSVGWSSPTLLPSLEVEFIASTSVLSPHKPRCTGTYQNGWLGCKGCLRPVSATVMLLQPASSAYGELLL